MKSAKKYQNIRLKLLSFASQSYQPALRKCASEFEAATGASIEVVAHPLLPNFADVPASFTSYVSSVGWWTTVPVAEYDATSGTRQFDLFCDDNEHQHVLWPYLLPLNDLITKFNYDMHGFFPAIYRYGAKVAGQHGLRFGLPVRMRVPCIYYRTDRIRKFPDTWEEFEMALAENTGGGIYGLAMDAACYPYHPFGYAHETTKLFLARYWSLGDPLFSGDWQPLIDSEKGVTALEMLKRQMSQYSPPDLITWDANRAVQAFVDGKIAFLELGAEGNIEVLRRLQDPSSKVRDKWSIGLYPGKGSAPLTYHTMSIFKHCKNPEAAFEFIAYCTGPKWARRLHLEYGENSARRSVMTSAEAIEKDFSVVRRAAALERAIPMSAPLPQWFDFVAALWEAVQLCLLGYLPAKAALTRAAQKWTALLRQAPPEWEYWE